MLEFIAAVYNEERELPDLIDHIQWAVQKINICDDGSTDETPNILVHIEDVDPRVEAKFIEHTGLPESVKAQALEMCKDGSWVIMLDADERFAEGVLESIRGFCNSSYAEDFDYVYFRQLEVIDGQVVREFQKCKLFRKEAMQFPLDNIHADDVLSGRGLNHADWLVFHRKSTSKQVQREIEYLVTYKKLLAEGKIDQGRYNWLVGLHHYVRPH